MHQSLLQNIREQHSFFTMIKEKIFFQENKFGDGYEPKYLAQFLLPQFFVQSRKNNMTDDPDKDDAAVAKGFVPFRVQYMPTNQSPRRSLQ